MSKGNADLFDLSGKVAVITGGSRGLGLEMSRAFARMASSVFPVGYRACVLYPEES